MLSTEVSRDQCQCHACRSRRVEPEPAVTTPQLASPLALGRGRESTRLALRLPFTAADLTDRTRLTPNTGSCFDCRYSWLKSPTTLGSDEASALAERDPRLTRRRSRCREVTCGAHQTPDPPPEFSVSSDPKRTRPLLTRSGQSVTYALHRKLRPHSTRVIPNRTYVGHTPEVMGDLAVFPRVMHWRPC